MHLNLLGRASDTGSGILRTVHPKFHYRGAKFHNSTGIPKTWKLKMNTKHRPAIPELDPLRDTKRVWVVNLGKPGATTRIRPIQVYYNKK